MRAQNPPPGGGFKRRGPEPPPLSLQGDRILKERGKFEIPLSLSGVLWLLSIDMERKQLAPAGATPFLPQAKKKHPLGRKHLYPRVSGRDIYLSPAAAGDIYFVRADRRGLIKHKKRSPRRKAIFTIPPTAAGGLYIYLTPSGVRYYLSLAVRPGIIKRKKERPVGKPYLLSLPRQREG